MIHLKILRQDLTIISGNIYIEFVRREFQVPGISIQSASVDRTPDIVGRPIAAAWIGWDIYRTHFVPTTVQRIPIPFDFTGCNTCQAQPGVSLAIDGGEIVGSRDRTVGGFVNFAGHAMIKNVGDRRATRAGGRRDYRVHRLCHSRPARSGYCWDLA